MDFKIPIVGKGVTLAELPNQIAVYFEIGGCIQNCPNCHSPYHQTQGIPTTLHDLTLYTKDQKAKGATAALLMGGTTSQYLTKQNLKKVIDALARLLPVGLYSGAEDDAFFFTNQNLSWYKTGSYIDTLGGLTSKTTNQKFYQRNKSGRWEIKNGLFQTQT